MRAFGKGVFMPFRLILGFDMNANPIEMLYNENGSNGVSVFHAMECQNQFLRFFRQGETI